MLGIEKSKRAKVVMDKVIQQSNGSTRDIYKEVIFSIKSSHVCWR